MNHLSSDELLTPAEAGAVVGATAETMRRWAADKKIRHVRTPSGRIKFRRSDLEDVFEIVDPDSQAAS